MSITRINERTLLAMPITNETVSTVLPAVCETVAENNIYDVIIDFSNVELLTSSNVSNLILLRQTLKEAGNRLILSSVSLPTKCIFTVTGLNDYFTFVKDRTEALNSLQFDNCN